MKYALFAEELPRSCAARERFSPGAATIRATGSADSRGCCRRGRQGPGCRERRRQVTLLIHHSRTDRRGVAVGHLPDLDAVAAELAHLRHRQRELLRQHDKLTERMLAFPNEFGRAWARSLAAEIEGMSTQIAAIEAELLFSRP